MISNVSAKKVLKLFKSFHFHEYLKLAKMFLLMDFVRRLKALNDLLM